MHQVIFRNVALGMPFVKLVASLQPMAVNITHLVLYGLNAATGNWRLLKTGLPQLEVLELHFCQISNAFLLAIPRQLPMLKQLTCMDCSGYTGTGWQKLLAACPPSMLIREDS